MSMIATVVKAALALDQKVQGLVGKGAHALASRNFKASVETTDAAQSAAEEAILGLERSRAKRAAALHEQFKASLIRLHEGVDASIELVEGRKQQVLGKAKQYVETAAMWQATSINAQVASENARKAAEQLT